MGCSVKNLPHYQLASRGELALLDVPLDLAARKVFLPEPLELFPCVVLVPSFPGATRNEAAYRFLGHVTHQLVVLM